jgi:hypothetical protein
MSDFAELTISGRIATPTTPTGTSELPDAWPR